MKKMNSKTLTILGILFLFLFFPVGIVLLVMALKRKREEVYDGNVAKRKAEEEERLQASLERVHASIAKQKAEEEAMKATGRSRSSSGEYEYKNVDVCILSDMDPDLSDVSVGDDVDLVLEPENEADGHAVAVYIGGQHVGYLYRGRLKSMVYDFLDRGDSVSAEVASVSGGVRLDIALSR